MRTIKELNNGYAVLDYDCVYYCSSEKDLNDLMLYTLESETSKGISSETHESKESALIEFNRINGVIVTLAMVKQYETLKNLKQGDTIDYTLNKYGKVITFVFIVKSINKSILKLTSLDLMPITVNIKNFKKRIATKEITNFIKVCSR